MTVNKAERDSGHVHSRRGLRKRWIALTTIIAFLVLAGMRLFQESSVARVMLPDGRLFNIHKTTVGKIHGYNHASTGLTSAEIWVNKWLARVGREIVPASRGTHFLSPTPSICLWHSFDWSVKESEANPHTIVLTDERGWRIAGDLSHMNGQPNPVPTSPGSPVPPRFLSVQMPSASELIKVELLNSRGIKLGSTQIPYVSPQDQLQNWSLQPFPITDKVENMSVTLVDLKAEWLDANESKPWNGDMIAVKPEYTVTIDGMASDGWIPFSMGDRFYESYSGAKPAVASVESPTGVTAPLDRCTVSPFESAWRLHLSLICRNPSQVTSAQFVNLTGISFDGGISGSSQAVAVPAEANAQVKLLGAGRAGSFIYEGAGETSFPIQQPVSLDVLTKGNLTGTFQSTPASALAGFNVGFASPNGATVRPPQFPVTVNLNLTAARPHLVISVTDSGDRYPYVVVKDQNGQVLEGELYNAQGLLIWLAKFPYTEIETVDAEVLLQTPRYFSFDVMPPTVPPRDSSDPIPSK